jgi:ABC-type bacteriocin/lantibiotic exporter with double-glycine peptidase domain
MWPAHQQRPNSASFRSQGVGLADLESPCGPVCLSLVSRIQGHSVSIQQASQLLSPDSLGRTSVSELVRSLNELGLFAQAVLLPIQNFAKLHVPAILHWRGSHFVVAVTNQVGEVMIFDPPRTPVVLGQGALAQSYGGIAVLVATNQAGLYGQLRDFGINSQDSADR